MQVLLVDDSPYNLIVLEELLKQIPKPITLVTALNGVQALKLMKEEWHLV